MAGVWHRKVGADWIPQSEFRPVDVLLASSRSSKDANGIFTVVEQRREDGSLDTRSTLSGGTSPEYTTRTVELFASDGTTVLRTITFTLAYDVDGDFISETVV